MSMMSRKGKFVIGVAGVALAVAVGLGSSASADGADPTHWRVDQSKTITDWPRNNAGLTYGSAAQAKSPADEPDLILAYGTNGKLGYVRRVDLEPPLPASPEHAVARQEARARTGVLSEQIPVYEVDGVTLIGVFIIDYSDTGAEQHPAANR